MNIVDIATEEAQKAKTDHISEINLEVGKLSGIIMEALNFALEEAVKNSVLENAKINITEKTAYAICEKCKHKFETEDLYTPCPKCLNPYSDIAEGKELKILSLKT